MAEYASERFASSNRAFVAVTSQQGLSLIGRERLDRFADRHT
jgi:hypothetical protein